jgi:hypothetical protein
MVPHRMEVLTATRVGQGGIPYPEEGVWLEDAGE